MTDFKGEPKENMSKITNRSNESRSLRNNVVPHAEDGSALESENLDSSDAYKRCPVCGVGIELQLFPEHIASCLQDSFKNTTGPADNLNLGKINMDASTCPVCQADVTFMNSVTLGDHMKRCREKDNRSKKMKKKSVLECPICGQHLKTIQGRKTHLKKCSSRFGLTAEALMVAVRNQEESGSLMPPTNGVTEENVNSANGNERLAKVKSRERKRKSSSKSRDDRVVDVSFKLSKSILEEIATDLVPDEDTHHSTESLSLVPCTTQLLDKFKGRKKTKKDKPVSILLKTSEDGLKETLTNRLACVLIQEELNVSGKPVSSFQKSEIEAKLNQDSDRSHWTLSAAGTSTDVAPVARKTFYVQSLVPPISPCNIQTGTKIRQLSHIPGRRRSAENSQGEVESQSKLMLKKKKVPTATLR